MQRQELPWRSAASQPSEPASCYKERCRSTVPDQHCRSTGNVCIDPVCPIQHERTYMTVVRHSRGRPMAAACVLLAVACADIERQPQGGMRDRLGSPQLTAFRTDQWTGKR